MKKLYVVTNLVTGVVKNFKEDKDGAYDYAHKMSNEGGVYFVTVLTVNEYHVVIDMNGCMY